MDREEIEKYLTESEIEAFLILEDAIYADSPQHEKYRRERTRKVLEGIKGVGPKTVERLMDKFEVEELSNADLSSIESIPHISKDMAQRIKKAAKLVEAKRIPHIDEKDSKKEFLQSGLYKGHSEEVKNIIRGILKSLSKGKEAPLIRKKSGSTYSLCIKDRDKATRMLKDRKVRLYKSYKEYEKNKDYPMGTNRTFLGNLLRIGKKIDNAKKGYRKKKKNFLVDFAKAAGMKPQKMDSPVKCPYCEKKFRPCDARVVGDSTLGTVAKGTVFLPWGIASAMKGKGIECPHCHMVLKIEGR